MTTEDVLYQYLYEHWLSFHLKVNPKCLGLVADATGRLLRKRGG